MSEPFHIYVDIETIPSLDPAIIAEFKPDFDSIVPDGRFKDEAKIEEDIARKRAKAIDDADTAYRKTGFDGATNHIASISYAAGEGKIIGYQNAALPQAGERMPSYEEVRKWESVMLRNFLVDIERELERAATKALIDRYKRDIAEAKWTGAVIKVTDDDLHKRAREALDHDPTSIVQPIIVAHHAQFDVRIIWQRAVALALGAAAPEWWPVNARPWDTSRIDDTMLRWAGATGRISLDKLCRALGLPGKSGFDGSRVCDAVRDGLIGEVLEYCCDDVARLRLAHRKMIGLPLLDADIYQLIDHDDHSDNETARDAAAFNAAIANAQEHLEGGAA